MDIRKVITAREQITGMLPLQDRPARKWLPLDRSAGLAPMRVSCCGDGLVGWWSVGRQRRVQSCLITKCGVATAQANGRGHHESAHAAATVMPPESGAAPPLLASTSPSSDEPHIVSSGAR